MTYSILEGGNPEGFWGKRTSLIDWCEENYILTQYVAEFFNTLSNLAFILLAALGFQRTIVNKMDLGFSLGYLSLIIVGLGSSGFHATLLYELQLMDELPMIFLSATMLYCCLLENNFKIIRILGNLNLLVGLLVLSGMSIWLYLIFQKPWIHQVTFGAMTAGFSLLMVPIAKGSTKTVRKLIWRSVFAYAFAFFLWNVDNVFCSPLRDLRNEISKGLYVIFQSLLPVWDPYSGIFIGQLVTSVLQLHAWWHILGAWAGYTGFCCLEYVHQTKLVDPGKTMRLKFIYKIIPVPEITVKTPQPEVTDLTSVKVVLSAPQYPKKQA